MDTGNVFNRFSATIKERKKGFSLLLLVVMLFSVVGSIVPSVVTLADDGSYKNLNRGQGTLTMNLVSGEQSPSWQEGFGEKGQGGLFSRIARTMGVNEGVNTPKWVLEGGEFAVHSLDEEAEDPISELMQTNAQGKFELSGLPLGKYKVEEVSAPEGYKLLEESSIIVELTSERSHAQLNFENKELTVLPDISKEWTSGSEAVDYTIDYQYYDINRKLVENKDVLFDTDVIDIEESLYFTPTEKINKVDIKNSKINIKDKDSDHYVYEVQYDGHNAIFLVDQVKRDIVVKKDFDGHKAEDVDIEIREISKEEDKEDKVVGQVTLSEKNNWTHTFQDLPRYKNAQLGQSISERDGEAIEYSVHEVAFDSAADGYASVVTGNEIDGFVIMNKELVDIDLTIKNVWVGKEGDASEFDVLVNGEVKDTVAFEKGKGKEWSKTITVKGVPYDAEVTVVENDVVGEDYNVVITEESDHTFVSTNIERLGAMIILKNKGVGTPETSLVYVGNDMLDMMSVAQESTRLEGATFLIEGKDSEYVKEVTTNKDGLALVGDIPFGDYTVTETNSPNGYVLGEVDSIDFAVNESQKQNIHRAEFYNERSKIEAVDLDITVTKEWEFEEDVSGFKIPEEVEMKLVSKLPNGEIHEESEPFTLNAGNKWTKEFTEMSNVNNTNDYLELDYTVVEINDSDVDYELKVTSTGSYFNSVDGNEVEILATNIEALGKIDVVMVEGASAPTEDFELEGSLRVIDGAKFELREKDSNKLIRESSTTKDGKFSMVNLPYGDYVLTQIEAPEGFVMNGTKSVDLTVDQPQTRGMVKVKFENDRFDTERIDVDVAMVWKDSEGNELDRDLVEDRDIKVELYRNEIKQSKFATLNAENNWTASFADLLKYEVSSDVEYVYTIEVVETDGYASEVTGDVANGFTITNTAVKEADESTGRVIITHENESGKVLADSVTKSGKIGETWSSEQKAIEGWEFKEIKYGKDASGKYTKEAQRITYIYKKSEVSEEDKETDKPETDKPETDEPVADEPGTEDPETDEPVTDEPGTDEPTGDNNDGVAGGVTDSEQSANTNDPQYVLVKDIYDVINGNTTYEDVVDLAGFEGTVITSSNFNMFDDLDMSEMYVWEFDSDKRIIVGFKDQFAIAKHASIDGDIYTDITLSSDGAGEAAAASEDGAEEYKQTGVSLTTGGFFAVLAGLGYGIFRKKKQ